MKTNFKFLSLMIGLVFAFTMAAFGQSQTGTVEGTVTDPTGKAVSGATVTLTNPRTGNSQTATTTDQGLFRFGSLVPGDYSLSVEGAGFSKAVVERVVVQVGTVATADVQMKVGGVGETVNVDIGDTEVQVDTTRQTVDGVITAKQIVSLPLNERNFLDLAVLQPGVTVIDGGNLDPTKTNTFRAVRVNGGSGTGTRVQIEGIDVTDAVVGMSTTNISTDAVQEFNLARSSFDLSTSLTTSGAVTIATRTGGNQFNGSAFWFLQDDRFDARPGFSAEKPEFNRDQYGYRVGGPIVKDRLFFFSNGERLDQQDFASFSSANFPDFNSEATLPIKINLMTNRFDFTATDNLRFFYLFNHSDDNSTGGTIRSPFQNINNTNTHVIGMNASQGNLTHSFRFGYLNFNNFITSTEVSGFEFPRGPGGTGIQLNVGDLSIGPNSLAPQQTFQDNHQFKYDGSWVAGSHVLRFGVDYTKFLLGGFANFSGPMTFVGLANTSTNTTNCTNPDDPFTCRLSDFLIGPDNGFFTAVPAHGYDFGGRKNNRYAWYVGDQWKVTRNFTLNLGVRWTYDTNFFAGDDLPRLTALDLYAPGLGDVPRYPKDAFSPQIGFAWDVMGDGKTSIRGGFYLAYEDMIFNNSLFDEFARIQTGIGPSQFDASHIFGPDGANIVVPGICPLTNANGDYRCLRGQRINDIIDDVELINAALQQAYANFQGTYDPNAPPSEFDAFGGVTFGGQFPGDFKIPYSMQFNLGFQRELARGHVLSVDYVRQRGVGLPYMLHDYEERRDARHFDRGEAVLAIADFLAACGQGTIAGAIANGCDDGKKGIFFPTIADFGLANDDVWPGLTDTNLRARLLRGGFSLYQGVQVSLNGRFADDWFDRFSIGESNILRGMSYTIAYALSRTESTSGVGRPEFIANTTDNRDYNSDFGPSPLDRTHNLTISTGMDLIGGFRLDSIFRFQTSPPLSVTIPNFFGSSGIFTSDFNGDGGVGGGAPRADLLPGTNIGDFGRRITNITALNQYIIRYNNDYAGQLTPHGQRLVSEGLFTEAQLRALGAVTPTIDLIPENNPNPFESRFNADMRLSRPIKLGSERFVLEPSFSVFNVFNNNAALTYGGSLTGGFGSSNYDYSDGSDLADLTESRGLAFRRRQLQFGIRFTF
jgi:hypothetical protein